MDFLYLYVFWNPSTDQPLENAFMWHVWLPDLFCLISLGPLPSDLKELDGTNGDAATLTAICWSRASG